MSLVVAQTAEDGLLIVSDTRVTFESKRPSYKTGTLKAIIVSPMVAICFAGDVGAGLDAVRNFARQLNTGALVDDLLPDLQLRTADRRRSVEFIVASANAKPRLDRVRGGQIEGNLQSAWIGDHNAFERFQKERLRPVDDWQLEMMSRMSPRGRVLTALGRGMDKVIADPSITSVSDFCVRLATKEGKLNYLEQSFIYVERDFTIKNGDNLITKMAQPVEDGGYAVSVVPPATPGTPALGLNFPRARMGMVYLPLEYDEAQVVHDVSPNEFSQVVLEKFGVALSQPMLRYH